MNCSSADSKSKTLTFEIFLPIQISDKRIILPIVLYGIRMDLIEIGVSIRNCVDSTQDRDNWRALVNAALNLRVP